jgi:hypothetical protein
MSRVGSGRAGTSLPVGVNCRPRSRLDGQLTEVWDQSVGPA